MTEQQSPAASPAADQPPAQAERRRTKPFRALRQAPTFVQTVFFGLLSIASVLGVWWLVTAGDATQRMFPQHVLPSPVETFARFKPLWFDQALTRNLAVTLQRVAMGFGLAAIVGIPLGVLCGCFGWARAFFAPVLLFGRNIPIAALTGLTFFFFGVGETQKWMFIFIACVAFVVSDTASAVQDVAGSYVDTAYTLGASRWQIVLKVLVPLAMPTVFNSLRVLFGLAFGYIMLAELVRSEGKYGGLGNIINLAQRRGPREYIFLILLIIPLVALAIDRLLFWIQRELFPHQYGGAGILNQLVRALMHAAESVKFFLWRLVGIEPAKAPTIRSAATKHAGDQPRGQVP
ncbi:MAG: ABC transporter permease [Pirellulales bacterium]|nr:ABC transporter permease [Pirellulales bacterium]